MQTLSEFRLISGKKLYISIDVHVYLLLYYSNLLLEVNKITVVYKHYRTC